MSSQGSAKNNFFLFHSAQSISAQSDQLTSAIFADVGRRAEAILFRVADGVAWTVVVDGAASLGDAFRPGVGHGGGSRRAGAAKGSVRVGAKGAQSARIRPLAFVQV